jgi:hypothetical protein
MVTVKELAQAESRYLAIALFILLAFAPLALIPIYADNDNENDNDDERDKDKKDKKDKKEKNNEKEKKDKKGKNNDNDNNDNDNDNNDNDNDNNDNDNDNNDNDNDNNDNEGCTPGFWKNHQNAWPTGADPDDRFEDVFGVDLTGDLDGLTMSEALNLGGGGLKALIRHAAAGVLNAAHSGVNYDFAVAEVIDMFQDAFYSGNYEPTKNMLEDENEEGCPLNNNSEDNDLIAVTDAAVTDEDTPVTINVLTNDIIDDDDYDFITISAVSNPTSGTSSKIGTDVLYTPNPDFFGIDSFTYTMTDGYGTSTGTVTVIINPVNDPPVLSPDPILDDAVDEGTSYGFTATATDIDLPPQVLTFTVTGAPSWIVIDTSAAGEVTLSGTPGESDGGTTSTITIEVSDGVATDSDTYDLTVNELNSAPILDLTGGQTIDDLTLASAATASLAVDELTLLAFTVGASDIDVPVQTLTFSLSGTIPAGASIDPSTGVFTWTPTEEQDGTYTFDVVVTDDGSPPLSDSATVAITVNEVNEAPVLDAVSDQTIDEETLLTFTATASDSDVPPQLLTFNLSGEPAGASITSAGIFTWTPTESQDGSYTFDVVVSDGTLKDSQTITVTVNEINTAPALPNPDTQTFPEGAPLSILLSASDADAPANTLTFTATGLPAWASINSATGEITGTPGESDDGTSSVTVTATDDGAPNLSDSETFDIIITEINEDPILSPEPIPDDAVDEGASYSFTATATDVDVPPQLLTFTVTGAPSWIVVETTVDGQLTLVGTPGESDQGTSTMTIVVSDGTATDSDTFDLTVNEVNEAPILDAVGSQTIDEETLLTFTATATDVDIPIEILSLSLSGAVPAGASIDPSTGVFTWTPTEEQDGTYTFDVVVTDDGSPPLSDSETITITVNEVNDNPVAIDDIITIDEDTSGTDVLANDYDVDGDSLTITSVTTPRNGAVVVNEDQTITYTPNTNYNGLDSFDYEISDGKGGTDTATVTVTINPVNDVPLADDQSITTDEDTPVDITLTASDVDGDSLSFSVVSGPAFGTLSGAAPNLMYTPNANFNGVDSFTFKANDGSLDSSIVTVSITVNGVNDAPAGNGDTATSEEDAPVVIDVLANDSDVDSDALAISISSAPSHGTALVSPDNTIAYTPSIDYNGPDSLEYKLSDGFFDIFVTVDITVNPVNDPPVLSTIGSQTVDEENLLTFTAVGTDVDADMLTFSLSGEPAGASITSAGIFTWTPTESQDGSYTFDVVVSDGTLSDSETVPVIVNLINDAPVLSPDPIPDDVVDEGVPYSFTASASDLDVPPQALTFSVTGTPSWLVIDTNVAGQVTLSGTPGESYGGTMSTITVEVSDGTTTDSDTYDLTVNEVNETPVANDQSVTTNEDTPVDIILVGSDVDGNPLAFVIVNSPAFGSLSGTLPELTYTPDANFVGSDSFKFTTSDDTTTSSPATVSITVNPVNDGPVADAGPDQTVSEGTIVTLNGTASADTDGDALSFSWTQIAGPSVTLSNANMSDPVFTAPSVDFQNVLTFELTVSDGTLTFTDRVDIIVNDEGAIQGSIDTPTSGSVDTTTGSGTTEFAIDTDNDEEDDDNDDDNDSNSGNGNGDGNGNGNGNGNSGSGNNGNGNSGGGCRFANLNSLNETNLPGDGMPDLDFSHGFFEFTIICSTPGSTVTVTLVFPENIPAGTQYWKYQNGVWYQLPDSLVGDNDGDNVLTITLTDGGIGDADGVANGVIVDPGGPGGPPGGGGGSTSGGSCDGRIVITNDTSIRSQCVILDLTPPKITKTFLTVNDLFCVQGTDDTGIAKIMVDGKEVPAWNGTTGSFCAKEIVKEGKTVSISATDFGGNQAGAIVLPKVGITQTTKTFLSYVDKEYNPHTRIEAIEIENLGDEPLEQVRLTLSPGLDRGRLLLSDYALKQIDDTKKVMIKMNVNDTSDLQGSLTVAAANAGIIAVFPIDVTPNDFHIGSPNADEKHGTTYLDTIDVKELMLSRTLNSWQKAELDGALQAVVEGRTLTFTQNMILEYATLPDDLKIRSRNNEYEVGVNHGEQAITALEGSITIKNTSDRPISNVRIDIELPTNILMFEEHVIKTIGPDEEVMVKFKPMIPEGKMLEHDLVGKVTIAPSNHEPVQIPILLH